jgi:hypothetical protein
MTQSFRSTRLSFSALALLATGCGPAPICDRAALEAALAAARPGDVVEVGACTIDGAFVLPDDVTLAGTSGTLLRSVGTDPVVRPDGPVGATIPPHAI